eukprot:Skav202731  [mRNA]  locus=scaffold1326:165235:167339:- [translate_table: standard]
MGETLRICSFMDQVEAKEGKEFDYLISHHAFTNAMTAAQIVERRHREGKTKLKHFNFVHGTALKMYIKEKEGDPEYPMRFLTKCQGSGVFSGIGSTQGARDLAQHLRAEDRGKVGSMKRLVTFVGKFADWKRLDAVLYAAKEFPSYKEPFGMVFIECMACGTPTIGANSGGPTEFVKPGQGVLIEEEADWRTEPGMKRRKGKEEKEKEETRERDLEEKEQRIKKKKKKKKKEEERPKKKE